DGEVCGQRHLAHQAPQVDAVVHALDGAVADVLGRVSDLGQPLVDLARATHRLTVAGDQHVRLQRNDPVDGMDVLDGAAVLVASDGVKVRHVAEYRAEQGTGEHGALGWQ